MPAMVAFLARRAREEGQSGLDARVMDGQKLDLPDTSFELACSVFGVMLFADHRISLPEKTEFPPPSKRRGSTSGHLQRYSLLTIIKPTVMSVAHLSRRLCEGPETPL